ncbi:hypothetical protein EBB45_15480 [Lysinibacillus composti]|uniref:Uncharacterized protein n=1 Tax=Lysinibacillus composti TaxID=720633 RepID=A0A3N9UAZ7_9BACI|nr:hypothetical protein EBB45_15480 [Lysinibacillus composti]
MVRLLENLHQFSLIMLFVCLFFLYRYLKKLKRERTLTSFEYSMFLIIKVAYLICAGSYVLLFLDRHY